MTIDMEDRDSVGGNRSLPDAGDAADETVAVVLAGGRGARLGALTRYECKPALPFGGFYRNIDFSLSNCANSGIKQIGVATPKISAPSDAEEARRNGPAHLPGSRSNAIPAAPMARRRASSHGHAEM